MADTTEAFGGVGAPAALEELLRRAEAAGASDVHLQRVGQAARVCFRLDGLLTPAWSVPDPLAEHLFGRIKFLARLKTYQESLPQDGRINQVDAGTRSDVRVSTYPTVTGEKIVLRLFQTAEVPGLGELGMPDGLRGGVERFLSGTAGLLLLTGPAGSGKTTTIYGCLRHLCGLGGRHIITVEDPVERVVPGVMQTEVNEAQGLDFARAARHLLRQDPQVLVIGEMRDEETVRIGLRAALTGHLVISTLHAGSCRGVFDRLLAMCPDPHLVAAAVVQVVNQRLVRRLCGGCRGRGCEACLGTGYKGRVMVAEWVRVSESVRVAVVGGDTAAVVPEVAIAVLGQRLLEGGVTDARELGRILQP